MFMLFGLLFVCLEDVNETFEYFVENAEENVDNLMDSVERVYVWEKYGRTRRSGLEDFHQKLGKFIHQYWMVTTGWTMC